MSAHEYNEPSIVIGTAGHIDHGKSTLVQALTGTDPDRLVEEKRRGITIELGFARLDLPGGASVGIVDVPGHEKFVRQMIAGATGIDAAILVVAADDGIMPQTREHLAVLRLLSVPQIVVALTKCDMVDEEWVEFMSGEIHAALACGPYAEAEIIPVAAREGRGLDELKAALANIVSKQQHAHHEGFLRMPIDRSFTVKGAGTVVTGSLWSGTVAPGDTVRVLPGGKKTRVRSVQIHGEGVDAAFSGHRVAMNLADVSRDDVRPGDFITALDAPNASARFDCELTYFDCENASSALESGSTVRVAHGTKEVFGRVLFMDGHAKLKQNEQATAQIRLDEPLCVLRGDRFVIRAATPVRVIGGGRVLAGHPRRRSILSESDKAVLSALACDDVAAAAQAYIEEPNAIRTVADIAGALDVSEAEAARIAKTIVGNNIVAAGSDADLLFATKQTLQRAASKIASTLLKFHATSPNELGMPKAALNHAALPSLNGTRFDAALAVALEKGDVVSMDGVLSHATAGAAAHARAQERADAAFALLEGTLTPPFADGVTSSLNCTKSEAYAALGDLEEQGRAVKIDRDLYYDAAVFNKLVETVRAHIEAKGPSLATNLKDAMGVSRKYAIPVLEALDDRGITKRDGDLRTL